MAKFITIPHLKDEVLINIDQIVWVSRLNGGSNIHLTPIQTSQDNRSQHKALATSLTLEEVVSRIQGAGGSVLAG